MGHESLITHITTGKLNIKLNDFNIAFNSTQLKSIVMQVDCIFCESKSRLTVLLMSGNSSH